MSCLAEAVRAREAFAEREIRAADTVNFTYEAPRILKLRVDQRRFYQTRALALSASALDPKRVLEEDLWTK